MLTRPHVARPIISDVTRDDIATVTELCELDAEVPEPARRNGEAETRLRELERAIGLCLRFAVLADLPALSDIFRRASLSNEAIARTY